MNNKLLTIRVVLSLVLTCSSAAVYGRPADDARVTIIIEPVFNGAPLKLADQYYVNEHGDTLFIDLFRFYITNLTFSNGSNGGRDANSHLVDAEDNASTTFHTDNLPKGSYSSMGFTLGVDSIANTNGANAGDLDPVKGMYWAWNSGYIMAKLEGHSNKCKTLHHAFEFHIGGYLPPYNAARWVNLQLPKAVTVRKGSNMLVRIKADAAAWFAGKLDLAKTNEVLIPGKEANAMADNYRNMFSIVEVSEMK